MQVLVNGVRLFFDVEGARARHGGDTELHRSVTRDASRAVAEKMPRVISAFACCARRS